MPCNKSFIQGYNAQATVEPENMLIVQAHITQNTNDKQEVEPVVEELINLSKSLPKIEKLIADTGYYSEKNVKVCEENNIDPYFATGRTSHNPSLKERFFQEPPELPENATIIEKMRHKLKTLAGKAVYKLRKQVVEPVFGIIKSAIGIREFRLRRLKNVIAEWKLICLSYNIKKINNIFNTL
jgi:hypothetical protein